MSRNAEGIDSNNGCPFVAIIKDSHAHLAGIVKLFMEQLAITTRLFHANFRCNISFRKTCFGSEQAGG